MRDAGLFPKRLLLALLLLAAVLPAAGSRARADELSVALSALPPEGAAPMDVELRVAVEPPADDPSDYYVWWDCEEDGVSLSGAVSACGDPSAPETGSVRTGVAGGEVTFSHRYETAGRRIAKVIVDRREGVDYGEDRASVTVTAALPPCTYSLTPSGFSAPASGGSGAIRVSASGECAWQATASDSWIAIEPPASGSGNGTVSFSVAANADGSRRAGSIAVAGEAFPVSQEGRAPCTWKLSSKSRNFPADGGTGAFTVDTGPGCGYTAVTRDDWIVVTEGGEGTDGGAVSYRVSPNRSSSPRTGTIVVTGGHVFTVSQAGLVCNHRVSPAGKTFPAEGGTDRFAVQAASGCAWTATPSAGWIRIASSASGTGDGEVSYSVSPNTGTQERSGTIRVGGSSFRISQYGAACSYAVSPGSLAFTSAGGRSSIRITTSGGCAWSVEASSAWIAVSPGSGNGSGSVSVEVPANPEIAPRSGAVIVAGQRVPVEQSGATIRRIEVSPTSVPFEEVTFGFSRDEDVTVRNAGNALLSIGQVQPPAAPFSIVRDDCSGKGLPPSGSCRIALRFSPTPSDNVLRLRTMTIPSDDPDDPSVTVAMTGRGVPPPVVDVPRIDVQPASLGFSVPSAGATDNGTVTVRSAGTASLVLSRIVAPPAPFAVAHDNCSGRTLPPGGTCEVTVTFRPEGPGAFDGVLRIGSSDPDRPAVDVTLSGSFDSATNHPPGKPSLSHPSNGALDVALIVPFTWTRATDPDGDPVAHALYVSTDPTFDNAAPASTARPAEPGRRAGMPGAARAVALAIGLLLALPAARLRGWRRAASLTAATLLAGLAISCGGGIGGVGGHTDPADKPMYKELTLAADTIYYWKVVAEDDKGGRTESDVYTFRTRP